MPQPNMHAGGHIPVLDTPADFTTSQLPGALAVVLSPLALYARNSLGQWVPMAAAGEVPPPTSPPATETVAGISELADTNEAKAMTDSTRAMTPARVKDAITPEGWQSPTLLNGWTNFGSAQADAGYRKLPWGDVQLRGVIKGGTMTGGTALFSLPSGYRPGANRRFVAIQGNETACRINVTPTGDVTINAVTDNTYLSLESVRFNAS
jgi:hypothetical protein